MAGPERRFIDSVHRQIDLDWGLWKQAMTGVMGANGTPDYYYELYNRALWVEYKWVNRLPEQILLIDHTKKYALSALQRAWLNRAVANKTPVAVVLGSKDGAVIAVGGRWNRPIARQEVEENGVLNTPRNVAEFIAGVGDRRVIVENFKDAGIQHEHASAGV